MVVRKGWCRKQGHWSSDSKDPFLPAAASKVWLVRSKDCYVPCGSGPGCDNPFRFLPRIEDDRYIPFLSDINISDLHHNIGHKDLQHGIGCKGHYHCIDYKGLYWYNGPKDPHSVIGHKDLHRCISHKELNLLNFQFICLPMVNSLI